MIYALDMFGVAVFAVTGSLVAGRKQMDLFGVVVLALVTALGGGTLRDLILGIRPVFWVSDQRYVAVACAAALCTFVAGKFRPPPAGMLLVADAFGLASFTVIGAQKTLGTGASGAVAVMMGVMTGVVGGMLRDLLSGEIPLILRREIYATASLCGAVVFVGLSARCPCESVNLAAGIAATLALRLAAIKWDLSLPVFLVRE